MYIYPYICMYGIYVSIHMYVLYVFSFSLWTVFSGAQGLLWLYAQRSILGGSEDYMGHLGSYLGCCMQSHCTTSPNCTIPQLYYLSNPNIWFLDGIISGVLVFLLPLLQGPRNVLAHS